MKKIILLAIIFAMTSTVFAQNVSPERPQSGAVLVMPQPISAPAVVVNNTINNNSFPGIGSAKKNFVKNYNKSQRPNLTFITNNNNYGDTTKKVVKDDQGMAKTPTTSDTTNDLFPNWFFPVLLLLVLLFLGAWLLMDGYTKRYPQQAPIAPAPPVIIHNNIPAAPKAETAKTVVTVDDGKEAMARAEATGGSFSRRADGSYKVEFPKPTIEAEKDKVQ